MLLRDLKRLPPDTGGLWLLPLRIRDFARHVKLREIPGHVASSPEPATGMGYFTPR